jgi:hypothetical protein
MGDIHVCLKEHQWGVTEEKLDNIEKSQLKIEEALLKNGLITTVARNTEKLKFIYALIFVVVGAAGIKQAFALLF